MNTTKQTPTAIIPDQHSEDIRTQSIIVSVRFGRPSQDCSNFGLCRIEQYKGGQAPMLNYATAKIWCDLSGSLYFKFDRNSMMEKTEHKFFRQQTFLIEEDVDLCCCISKSIGWKSNPIKKGQYILDKTTDSYVLNIR